MIYARFNKYSNKSKTLASQFTMPITVLNTQLQNKLIEFYNFELGNSELMIRSQDLVLYNMRSICFLSQ